MIFSSDDVAQLADFRTNTARQEAERATMRSDGAAYGRTISDVICREAPAKVFFSNSGRDRLAQIARKNLKKQADRLRAIGFDETNIALFLDGAYGALAWLGVQEIG